MNKLLSILNNCQLTYSDKSKCILNLADQQDKELYKEIINYLDNNGYTKHTSLLIYALNSYPSEPLMDRAINWLIKGNFEIAHSAFNILNNIEEIEGEKVENAFYLLNKALVSSKEEIWRYDLISDVLDMFD